MRSVTALFMALTLFASSLTVKATEEARSPQAEVAGQPTAEEEILERKQLLLLFPLAAAGAVVIALIVTRRKRPRGKK